MKEAIGVMNGWKCPKCKRLVKCPDYLKYLEKGEANGECSYCHEPLHFTKVKFVKEEQFMKQWKEQVKELWDDSKKVNFRKAYDMDPKSDIEERPVAVNFLNKPKLYKWLKKYAIDKDLYLSEVVVGFVSMGVKRYLRDKKVKFDWDKFFEALRK
jgi:hypothetical protein